MRSEGAGSVLYALDSHVRIALSHFTECEAENFGGAVVTSATIEIEGSAFDQCGSRKEGGAVFAFDGADVAVRGARFTPCDHAFHVLDQRISCPATVHCMSCKSALHALQSA
eukprot:3562352-Rhodomonas_salina.2